MSTELAYWAGLFDGEGCITVSRSINKRLTPSRPYYTLEVRLENTYEPVVRSLHERYGGTFYARTRPHRTEIFCMKLCSKKAVPFLLDVLPFLQIKREEAEIALEFQELAKRKVFSPKPLTDEEIAVREEYKRKLESLKTRNNL